MSWSWLPRSTMLCRDGLCLIAVEDVAPVVCGVRTRRGRLPRLLGEFIELLAR